MMVEGRLQHGQTDAVTEEAVVRDKSFISTVQHFLTVSCRTLLCYNVGKCRNKIMYICRLPPSLQPSLLKAFAPGFCHSLLVTFEILTQKQLKQLPSDQRRLQSG